MSDPPGRSLGSSARPLADDYDVALLDLDGVVYLGTDPIPGVPEALDAARARGMRLAFVTNNASRTPAAVATHLCDLGVHASADEVVTSAQAAARLLAERLRAGDPVLVIGGPGLREAVEERGLRVVTTAVEHPAAVAQGYSRSTSYDDLAEACLAIRAGAWWVASNGDATIPTSRGLLPGNGAFVAALSAATGQEPVVAGKPETPLHAEAVRRTGARRPLVVGDRLDTDIEGALRGGADSLLVLTGVTDPATLLAAGPHQRPTYLGRTLDALLHPHPEVSVGERSATCRGWRVQREPDEIVVRAPQDVPVTADPDAPDPLDGLRALCALVWTLTDEGEQLPRVTGDPRVAGGLAPR